MEQKMMQELSRQQNKEWQGFKDGVWQTKIDVRDFIQTNYAPYLGDELFLSDKTEKTALLWAECLEYSKKERDNGGVLSIDTTRVTGINAYGPGYIQQENEVIVGLQTEKPLERSINPFGGLRMAKQSCEAYGVHMDKTQEEFFENIGRPIMMEFLMCIPQKCVKRGAMVLSQDCRMLMGEGELLETIGE
jgi:formate C-acetyltransferase